MAIGICAAILCAGVAGAAAAEVEVELSEDGGSKRPGYVYVEPPGRLLVRNGERVLPPYLERRGSWGATVALAYGTFEPRRYEPQFTDNSFGAIYRAPQMPLLALNVEVKKNFGLGSLALGFLVGAYRTVSGVDTSIADSTFTYEPVKLGLSYYADALDDDPVFVPYLSGGLYTMYYDESQGDQSYNGHTKLAPWASLGVDISLNWLDGETAKSGYDSVGIQNTALFLELQKYVSSPSETDPDFGNDVSFAAGLRIEF